MQTANRILSPVSSTGNQTRQDFLGHQVILAYGRDARPKPIKPADERKVLPANCDFCPGNEHKTGPELFSIIDQKTGGWTARVVPNKHPAVEGHEVLIDTHRHDHSLSQSDRDVIHRW